MQQCRSESPKSWRQLLGREQLLLVLADELRVQLSRSERWVRHNAPQEVEVGVESADLRRSECACQC